MVVFLKRLFDKLAFIPLIAVSTDCKCPSARVGCVCVDFAVASHQCVEVAVVLVGTVAVKVLLASVIGAQDDVRAVCCRDAWIRSPYPAYILHWTCKSVW